MIPEILPWDSKWREWENKDFFLDYKKKPKRKFCLVIRNEMKKLFFEIWNWIQKHQKVFFTTARIWWLSFKQKKKMKFHFKKNQKWPLLQQTSSLSIMMMMMTSNPEWILFVVLGWTHHWNYQCFWLSPPLPTTTENNSIIFFLWVVRGVYYSRGDSDGGVFI